MALRANTTAFDLSQLRLDHFDSGMNTGGTKQTSSTNSDEDTSDAGTPGGMLKQSK